MPALQFPAAGSDAAALRLREIRPYPGSPLASRSTVVCHPSSVVCHLSADNPTPCLNPRPPLPSAPVPGGTSPATALQSQVDKNYVSFWFWFFMPFLIGIPCIGPIIAIVLAFAGENESRKNYFRAMLAWMLIALTIGIIVMVVFGLSIPVILAWLKEVAEELERQRGGMQ